MAQAESLGRALHELLGWPVLTDRMHRAWLLWKFPGKEDKLPSGPEREAALAAIKQKDLEKKLAEGWTLGPPIKRSELKF